MNATADRAAAARRLYRLERKYLKSLKEEDYKSFLDEEAKFDKTFLGLDSKARQEAHLEAAYTSQQKATAEYWGEISDQEETGETGE